MLAEPAYLPKLVR